MTACPMTTGSRSRKASRPSWSSPSTRSSRAWAALAGAPGRQRGEAQERPGVQLLARVPDAQGGHPLLATGTFGRGRTLAWTSDIGPHWLPQPFADWPGYARLWRQCLSWLTEGR